jgi:K+-transporting ATPase A subunit
MRPSAELRRRHDHYRLACKIVLVLSLVVDLAYPLGGFLVELFEGRRTILSPVLAPVERSVYRLAGSIRRTSKDGSPVL